MATRREFSRLGSGLIAGAAVALVVTLLHANRALERLEFPTYDMRMRWTLPEGEVHPEIALFIVTEESIDWMEEKNGLSWPWDREAFAFLFRACALGKARAVLFDFFTHIDAGEGEDSWAAALRAGPPSFFAVPFLKDKNGRADARPDLSALLLRFAVEIQNDGSVEVPEEPYRSVKLPRPKLAAAVAGACDVSTPRESDGLIRRYRLFTRFRGRHYPSFALAALMARERAAVVRIRGRWMTVGSLTFPVEPDGTIQLRFLPPGKGFALKPASRVIRWVEDVESGKAGTSDPAGVNGRIVLMGTNAPGLVDIRQTPVSESTPGVEIHATAIANLLDSAHLRLGPRWLSFVLIGVLALATSAVTRLTSAIAGGISALILATGYGLITVSMFQQRWVLDLMPQASAIFLAYATASTINFIYEGRQRLRVKRQFQRYVSPKVVDKILKNPDSLHMAGERKPLSIFFMDFAGFTTLSESLDPTELVKLVSEYHHEAAGEIFRTEGTLDKYIGDAIMAYWNDPIDQPDHAWRACRAALGAQDRLRALAAEMRKRGLSEMRARIGINSGIATVGDMGAQGQANYTVMGDEVNLASRLEGVNKEFGTEIIASEAAFGPARDRIEGRELALIKVKGKQQSVRIFELLGVKGEVPAERLERARAFQRTLGDFRARRWAEARAGFAAALEQGDEAARPYLPLCDHYVTEPPPPDWDGSYKMDHK